MSSEESGFAESYDRQLLLKQVSLALEQDASFEFTTAFAKNIRLLCEIRNITLGDFVYKMGDTGFIRKLDQRRHYKHLSAKTFTKLADVLNVTPVELFKLTKTEMIYNQDELKKFLGES